MHKNIFLSAAVISSVRCKITLFICNYQEQRHQLKKTKQKKTNIVCFDYGYSREADDAHVCWTLNYSKD